MTRAVCGCLLLLAGCGTNDASIRSQSRMFVGESTDEVFEAGALVLRREFGRITVEQPGRRLRTEPVEYTSASDSGRARDLVGLPSSVRRVASFSVDRSSQGAIARLRIDVERRDTTERGVFQPDAFRISDTPGYTPIERDAATTSSQNVVWTPVKRDSRLERALLAEIEESLNQRGRAPEPPLEDRVAPEPVGDEAPQAAETESP